jgi:hypothetical protein
MGWMQEVALRVRGKGTVLIQEKTLLKFSQAIYRSIVDLRFFRNKEARKKSKMLLVRDS